LHPTSSLQPGRARDLHGLDVPQRSLDGQRAREKVLVLGFQLHTPGARQARRPRARAAALGVANLSQVKRRSSGGARGRADAHLGRTVAPRRAAEASSGAPREKRASPRRRAGLIEQLGGEAHGGATRAPQRRVVFGRGDVFGRRGEEVEVGDWRVSLDAEALQGCGGVAG